MYIKIVFILAISTLVLSENVLVLLPLASKSHKNIFEPIITGLAERKHVITVVSPFVTPAASKFENVRDLIPDPYLSSIATLFGDPIAKRAAGPLSIRGPILEYLNRSCHAIHESPEFMGLLDTKFDLVLFDAFLNDCAVGFMHRLGAPFALLTTTAAPPYIMAYMGNRMPNSFVPSTLMGYTDVMSLKERLLNFGSNLFFELVNKYYMFPKQEEIYRKYLGEETPGIEEVVGEASLLFSNSHFSMTLPRPLLPDVVEVGGMHIKSPKPLPKDLEEFASSAKDGFIFFSLGSIVQGSELPEEKRQIFVNVFSRLKQKVLWKWETDSMADAPKNVKLGKWLPQQDILAHPNLKIFITHGGLLSTLEATYHGVPLIGFPIFGDQDINMKNVDRAGYGINLEILDLTEEKLEAAINKILGDESFKSKAQALSTVFKDQKETPLERAIYWSEYIMRHKGAIHLRSGARQLNFFQYYSIDIAAIIMLLLVAILWAIKFTLNKLFQLCFGKTKVDKKKKTK